MITITQLNSGYISNSNKIIMYPGHEECVWVELYLVIYPDWLPGSLVHSLGLSISAKRPFLSERLSLSCTAETTDSENER